MARKVLNTQTFNAKGKNLTNVAEAIGDEGASFFNDGSVVVLFINDTEGAGAITIPTPMKVDGDLDVGEREYSVSAGEILIAGPFSRQVYNQDDGSVYINADNEDTQDVKVVILE